MNVVRLDRFELNKKKVQFLTDMFKKISWDIVKDTEWAHGNVWYVKQLGRAPLANDLKKQIV